MIVYYSGNVTIRNARKVRERVATMLSYDLLVNRHHKTDFIKQFRIILRQRGVR